MTTTGTEAEDCLLRSMEPAEPVASQRRPQTRDLRQLNGGSLPPGSRRELASRERKGSAKANSFFSVAAWPLRFCSLSSRRSSASRRRSRRHVKQLASQQAKQEQTTPPKGSVTPLMDTVRTPAPDNTSGQLGPGDIRRTRSLDNGADGQASLPPNLLLRSSLGAVPSFADTQQKWEDPAPYGGTPPAEIPQTQQNSLKEPSLIFVRSAGAEPGSDRTQGQYR